MVADWVGQLWLEWGGGPETGVLAGAKVQAPKEKLFEAEGEEERAGWLGSGKRLVGVVLLLHAHRHKKND